MRNIRRPAIIVGASGSRASIAALRWAAEEARRRDARLIAVRAWQPAREAHYAVTARHQDAEHQRRAVTWELASTLRSAFGARLPAHLFTEVIEDMAERALADRSVGADLLVLGSASSPDLSGRSIGPVIRSCLSRAHCPVVVIGAERFGATFDAHTMPGESAAGQQNGRAPAGPEGRPGVRHGRPARLPARTGTLASYVVPPRAGGL